LAIGFQPSDLKLVTAVFVLLTLLSTAARKKRGGSARKKLTPLTS